MSAPQPGFCPAFSQKARPVPFCLSESVLQEKRSAPLTVFRVQRIHGQWLKFRFPYQLQIYEPYLTGSQEAVSPFR